MGLLLVSLALFLRTATACKRGIAFPSGQFPDDIFQVENNTVICWQYGWDVPVPVPFLSELTHVPMQWGQDDISDFYSTVTTLGATTILGFNEPDMPGQSALSSNDAASLWLANIYPLKASGVRLGSPAVSSGPNGTSWMGDFLRTCQGCAIDFLALHWYGEGAENFKDYVQNFHEQFPDYPLWITEFASTSGDPSEVLDFCSESINFLDSVDYVEKYSWFIFGRDSTGLNSHLLDSDGNLNALGRLYTS